MSKTRYMMCQCCCYQPSSKILNKNKIGSIQLDSDSNCNSHSKCILFDLYDVFEHNDRYISVIICAQPTGRNEITFWHFVLSVHKALVISPSDPFVAIDVVVVFAVPYWWITIFFKGNNVYFHGSFAYFFCSFNFCSKL